MELVLFIVVFISLWLLFYCGFSLLPTTQLRTVMRIFSMNAMTREYLLEIANCAVAVVAAMLIASIAVWYAMLIQ